MLCHFKRIVVIKVFLEYLSYLHNCAAVSKQKIIMKQQKIIIKIKQKKIIIKMKQKKNNIKKSIQNTKK